MSPEGEARNGHRTGIADSLIREIADQLDNLARTGEVAAIDLRSLPMTEADRVELAERLGRGEVDILFNVAGTSEAWETNYAGVWWVRHRGADDRIAAERIEIAPVPDMLTVSGEDIAMAAARLRSALNDLNDDETPPEADARRAHA